MENAGRPKAWLVKLVRAVAAVPGANEKTVFELQASDWQNKRPIPSKLFAEEIRCVQDKGAVHLAYYPDDFNKNMPALARLIPVFSASSYPASQR